MYISFHSGLIFSNMDVSNASIDHYIQDQEETQEGTISMVLEWARREGLLLEPRKRSFICQAQPDEK